MADQQPKVELTAEQAARKKKREDAKAEKQAKFEAKKKAAAAKAKPKGQPKQQKPAQKPKEQFVNKTPEGKKKDMSEAMASAYNPVAVESAWYSWWEKEGFFKPNGITGAEKFIIVIPPPNITGSLHLGHALTTAIQDSLVRWHRMKGHNTLWVPGTDHAGIATQVVVEKKLKREENLSRHDLGREKFIEKVWEWKDQFGDRITKQSKRLGGSYDWSREVFTMDEKLSKAVTEAFVRYFDKGLIFRGTRLVNWCVTLKTAISDIEVDHVDFEKITKRKVPGHEGEYEFGALTSFAYKIEGSDDEIVVATTRPETMLADTAIAVHPKDERYTEFHNKFAVHPFNDRKIPIITDDVLVEMEFGTGAVKVTPAHDPNDFATGKRHNLEFINLLNLDGTINSNGGKFEGQKRFDARINLVNDLKELGLFRGVQDNAMNIGICSRSGDIIEPMLMPQWWVDSKEMAARSVKVVENGELEIIPSHHKDTWFRWLNNIQDWCISRQLWWGHRIPAYLISIDGKSGDDTMENWVVGRNEEEALENAVKKTGVAKEKITLSQDPDVLDTWFSSGLFPFSVMGWPDETEDFKNFYPTTLLETGQDILFFWVARMVMMGLTLTDKLPFTQTLLHAIVRDPHGRKMSKSLGNVIDPVDVIEGITLPQLHEKLQGGNLDPKEIEKAIQGQKQDYPNGIGECGSDALRFALCAYMSQGRDINLDINRVVAYRNFCNKLWNATKFALSHLGENFVPDDKPQLYEGTPMDKWILNRAAFAIDEVNTGLESFNFERATTGCYAFWLYDLCDVYLESIKSIMFAPQSEEAEKQKTSARQTLYTCLDIGIRLLHPFMPFVTEELFQRLPRRANEDYASVCIATFPERKPDWINKELEETVAFVQEIIHCTRSLRGSYLIPNSKKAQTAINFFTEEKSKIVEPFQHVISALGSCSSIEIAVNREAKPGESVGIVNQHCEVHLSIKELVQIDVEITKLEKKKEELEKNKTNLKKKTESPNYEKVPEKVRNDNSKKLEGWEKELEATQKILESFKKLKV